MPQNSTRKPGAITSGMLLPFAAASCALRGRPDDVAARFLVRVKLDQALLLRFLQEIGEGAKAVVGLVEAGVAALERLLDHRAPDLLVGAALRDERLERAEHHVEGFLLLVAAVALVAARAGRRGLLALLRRAPLLLVGAHQVVVVDELVAVVDQQVGARIL